MDRSEDPTMAALAGPPEVASDAPLSAQLDAALVAAQRGDPDAFRLLYRDTQPRLLRYLHALTGATPKTSPQKPGCTSPATCTPSTATTTPSAAGPPPSPATAPSTTCAATPAAPRLSPSPPKTSPASPPQTTPPAPPSTPSPPPPPSASSPPCPPTKPKPCSCAPSSAWTPPAPPPSWANDPALSAPPPTAACAPSPATSTSRDRTILRPKGRTEHHEKGAVVPDAQGPQRPRGQIGFLPPPLGRSSRADGRPGCEQRRLGLRRHHRGRNRSAVRRDRRRRGAGPGCDRSGPVRGGRHGRRHRPRR